MATDQSGEPRFEIAEQQQDGDRFAALVVDRHAQPPRYAFVRVSETGNEKRGLGWETSAIARGPYPEDVARAQFHGEVFGPVSGRPLDGQSEVRLSTYGEVNAPQLGLIAASAVLSIENN